VSMPMRRIDSIFSPMRISMVSPSITCSTVALLGSIGVVELLLQPDSSNTYVKRINRRERFEGCIRFDV
jgi:hypothetical protein